MTASPRQRPPHPLLELCLKVVIYLVFFIPGIILFYQGLIHGVILHDLKFYASGSRSYSTRSVSFNIWIGLGLSILGAMLMWAPLRLFREEKEEDF